MAAKKTAPKSAKKTAAAKGTKKAAKAVTKKAASKPAARSGASKSAAQKAAPKKAAKAAAAPKAPAATPPEPSASKPKGAISSKAVNLSHVLALRPRVSASFKADSLREARQLLEDEGYATLEEAARAVAEKALELTRDGTKGRSGRGRR
jgi:hypothetical protein